MRDNKNNPAPISKEAADVLLQQLFHLKSYEKPDVARMTRNKQNIMRQVREVNSRKRWSLSDLLEVNIPWFFAEPKYGVALLFIAFAGLQYLGINTRPASHNETGIYTGSHSMAVLEQSSAISTNSISYPKLPNNLDLFPEQQVAGDVKFVGRIESKK